VRVQHENMRDSTILERGTEKLSEEDESCEEYLLLT
jgi:hypothetical protein